MVEQAPLLEHHLLALARLTFLLPALARLALLLWASPIAAPPPLLAPARLAHLLRASH